MKKNKSIDGLTIRNSKNKPKAKSKAANLQVASKPTPKKRNSHPKPKTTKLQLQEEPVLNHTDEIFNEESTVNETIAKESVTSETINEDFLKPVQAFDFDEASGDLKASEKPITKNLKPEKKAKKEKKKVSKKRKIITSIILFIVLLLIGGITYVVLWGNDIIAKITGGQGNVFDLIKFIEPTYERLKTDENGRTNILAFGTSGYNMEGDEGHGKHAGAQLTDSIMAISLNQDTGDVVMLSLPRDLKASPTCTATGKINEVYWCKNISGDNEEAGATALMTEVGSILGVDFQYYAHLNWGSLVDIVNTLGGIKITLDEDISDYYYTKAVFKAGVEYTIDGEQALGLARARHGTTSGDFSRGASQQKILIGIKDKVFEKSLSLTDIVSLASALGDNLRTNFSIDELKSMAHLTFDFDFDNIRQISLLEPERLMTTGTINGISYVLPIGGAGNYSKIQSFVSKMLSNDPRVYETPTILVLNGTEEVGLAGTEKSRLEKEGYTNIVADNAPEGTYPEKYTVYAVTNEKPGTKSLLEKLYELEANPIESLPENISKDYDFIIILGGQKETEEETNVKAQE